MAKATPRPPSATDGERVVLATFGAPHGVRGEIRLKAHTGDPAAVADYGPLEAPDGRTFVLTSIRAAAGRSPDMLVVRVEGITTRNAAEALNGVELSVPRERLPQPEEDDFYHADLIGLSAETIAGEPVGSVAAILNHGAGDLLDIARPGAPSVLVPFTHAAVPTVDIAGGRIVIDPPAGLFDDSGDGEAVDEN